MKENETTRHTPGPWQIEYGFVKQERKDGQKVVRIVAPHPEGGGQDIAECLECCANLFVSAPDLLSALKEAKAMLETAKGYFPKSIQNRDRFSLLNVLANAVDPAIAKAEGRAL